MKLVEFHQFLWRERFSFFLWLLVTF